MSNPLPINRIYLEHSLSETSFGESPDYLYYVKLADGRRHIYRQLAEGGLAQPVTTEPAPSGGIGYGGGTYTVHGPLVVFAGRGGVLYGLDTSTGEQWAITPPFEGVAAPVVSPCGRYVAFLAEQGERANVLLADIRGRQLPVKLSNDPWYAFNPAFSPDGARVAWMEWNEHDMPWDESQLVVARLARPMAECDLAAQALPLETTTIAQPRVSYSSPQFSPDGRWLAYTSDESGWRSLWVTEAGADDLRGAAVRVDTGEGEIGGPDWNPGHLRVRWRDDGRELFAIRRCRSTDRLLHVAWPGGVVTEVDLPYTQLSYLNTRGDQVIFIGARYDQPPTAVTLDLATGRTVERATGAVGLLDKANLSEPRVLSWTTVGGGLAWGVLYPARTEAGDKGPRPLIVDVHGGPTSERAVTWDAQAQYFATRGWHYLLVNHRGGTGYGRAYQDLLVGQWGVVDVEDARSGAEHLVQAGLADPQRLVITGGSAGGYTTCMALTQHPGFWAAGVGRAPVTDLYELRLGSHRFEVNYEFGLVGRLPEAGPLWKQRSPLTHASKVRAPVLLFHGKEDKAVPTRQSIDYIEAVRRAGAIGELVLYEGEGHSFVREANRRDFIERMERFLDKYVLAMQR